jgi:hypothetical protein
VERSTVGVIERSPGSKGSSSSSVPSGSSVGSSTTNRRERTRALMVMGMKLSLEPAAQQALAAVGARCDSEAPGLNRYR